MNRLYWWIRDSSGLVFKDALGLLVKCCSYVDWIWAWFKIIVPCLAPWKSSPFFVSLPPAQSSNTLSCYIGFFSLKCLLEPYGECKAVANFVLIHGEMTRLSAIWYLDYFTNYAICFKCWFQELDFSWLFCGFISFALQSSGRSFGQWENSSTVSTCDLDSYPRWAARGSSWAPLGTQPYCEDWKSAVVLSSKLVCPFFVILMLF